MTRKEIDQIKSNIPLLLRAYKERLAIEESETKLAKFVKLAWPVIEPGTPYVHGWHIDAICEHLEAVVNGEIRKLIINISPRSSKSTVLSVCWPAWVWIRTPVKKWLFTSYDLKLSKRDSRKCRQLIKSAWYQSNWNSRFEISRDQDEKHRFENNHMGYRLATSVDAGTTGEGGDIIVMDDPNDVKQMTSDAYIEEVINYHDTVLSSRLNDPKTGCRVLIQQRSHELDLTGHILSKERGWEHLTIPMEYEGRKKISNLWEDPRKTEGDLMCPERIGPLEVEELKRDLGPVAYAGQYQQRPSPGEGARFKREWWNFYNLPGVKTGSVYVPVPGGKRIEKEPVDCPQAFEQVVQAWDMAFKESKDHDLVAGHAWGRVGANVYLLARDSNNYDFPQTLNAVRRMSQEYPCPEKLVEDKANGPAVIQTLRNEIPGIIPSSIQGGLESLATSITGYCEAGNVFLPNPDLHPWVYSFIEQFAVYPRGKHDDDVAAAGHALRRLFDSVSNAAAPEFRVSPRKNEPSNANHIQTEQELRSFCQPHWRRWIAVASGHPGAALWFVQTPTGSLRVVRELHLGGVDAYEAGRRIAEASIEDIRQMWRVVSPDAKYHMEVLMEKECFAPIEPIGSYAELLEQGMMEYEPCTGSFLERENAKLEWRQVNVASDMIQIEDSVFDRLRELLRFAPPDFTKLPFDRKMMFELAQTDHEAFMRYIAAVEGKVHGEFPKIKFSASCKNTIGMLGTARRSEETSDPFFRALLIGVAAGETMEKPILRAVPQTANGPSWMPGRNRMRRAI